MAYIEWEDADGTQTLTPSYPSGPARRFRGWTPNVKPIGPARHALGTGQRDQFQFRRDYLATFSIPGLSPLQLEQVMRLKVHALSGCTFLVYCEDTDEHVYECRLAEGEDIEIEMSDAQLLEYTMSITVKNIENDPMLCNYRSA